MSGGVSCENRADHQASWVVRAREANYSAFNGYRRTPSIYSEVICPICLRRWRTRASYVGSLPDEGAGRG